MTEEKQKLREELRLKMVELQNEASKYRREIEKLDNEDQQTLRDSIINKCFRQNASTKESPSWHGYAFVERFDENFQPIGVIINWYSEDDKVSTDCHFQFSTNSYLHLDWLLNGEEISKTEFESYLKTFLQTVDSIELFSDI